MSSFVFVGRVLQQLLETLGVILHRENARAVLRRSRVYTAGSTALLAAATTLQAEAATLDASCHPL